MPADQSLDNFSENLVKMGVDITSYHPNDLVYLWKVGKLCAKQAGLPLGAAVGVASAGVGSMTVPVIGVVPGYVAGFLAGAVGGTLACTIARMSLKRDLDKLLSSTPQFVKKNVISTQ